MARKKYSKAVLLLPLFLGFFFMAIGVIGGYRDIKTYLNGEVVEGKVVGFEEDYCGSRHNTVCYARNVQFTTSEGKEITFTESSYSSGINSDEIGSTVEVAYFESSPKEAVIKEFGSVWLIPLAGVLFGGLAIVIAIVGFIMPSVDSEAYRALFNSRKSHGNIPGIAFIVPLVIGIIFILIGYFLGRGGWDLYFNGEHTRGEITGVAGECQNRIDTCYERFVTFETKNGEEVKFRDDFQTRSVGLDTPEIGEKVDVMYDRNSPEDAVVKEFGSIWFFPGIFIVLGSGALFLSIVGFLFRKSQDF